MANSVAAALRKIYQQIESYPNSDLLPKERLVAVSKRQPVGRLVEALEAGHRVFGENTLQEIEVKWPALKARYEDTSVHFIGAVQSRKLEAIVEHCDVIQSIDRVKLLHKLAKIGQNMPLPEIMLQVNIGREAQKSGCAPEKLDELLAVAGDLAIKIRGIMCIPPVGESPVPCFDAMAALRMQHSLPVLSMGMSGDYVEALACGATHIRVGNGVFGVRNA